MSQKHVIKEILHKCNANKNDLSESDYCLLISAAEGSRCLKKLAAVNIPKYFHKYPNVSAQAIKAQFSLCEDDEIVISKRAVLHLPKLCAHNKEYVNKIAEKLALFLLQPRKLDVLWRSIYDLIKRDPEESIRIIYTTISLNQELLYQYLCFLSDSLNEFDIVLSIDFENWIILKCENILNQNSPEITFDMFLKIISLLERTGLGRLSRGREKIFKHFINFEQRTVILEDRIKCLQLSVAYAPEYCDYSTFISEICTQLLVHLDEKTIHRDLKLRILQTLAEMVDFCPSLKNIQECLTALFKELIVYIQPPYKEPYQIYELAPPMVIYIECLLFTFSKLLEKTPHFLDRFDYSITQFKYYLTNYSEWISIYESTIQDYIKMRLAEDYKNKESRFTMMRLRTMRSIKNIKTIAETLVHQNLFFDSIHCSWKMSIEERILNDTFLSLTRETIVNELIRRARAVSNYYPIYSEDLSTNDLHIMIRILERYNYMNIYLKTYKDLFLNIYVISNNDELREQILHKFCSYDNKGGDNAHNECKCCVQSSVQQQKYLMLKKTVEYLCMMRLCHLKIHEEMSTTELIDNVKKILRNLADSDVDYEDKVDEFHSDSMENQSLVINKNNLREWIRDDIETNNKCKGELCPLHDEYQDKLKFIVWILIYIDACHDRDLYEVAKVKACSDLDLISGGKNDRKIKALKHKK